jgi:hypothetical protein
MESARRGGMNEYLETFYKVFQDQFDPAKRPTAVDVIAPIQDVVFDHKGKYYAAVPLDFREEDYMKWLERRTGPQAAQAIFRATSEKPLEVSRYITSVFATLEGNGFVDLVEAADEGLDAELVKQKLDQQGSVYAQADAFRLYRFRQRAWAQILMQSVGSSAAESERLARRRQREGSWERPPVQIPAQEGKYLGEATSVDEPDAGAGPRRSLTGPSKSTLMEDVSSTPALEDKRSEGIDEDNDENEFNDVKFEKSRNGGGSVTGRPSGSRED